jgi:2-polyprenyl-3-methyl-5-hydroxy-6-metoxy-1,4-benzoquinol methylase
VTGPRVGDAFGEMLRAGFALASASAMVEIVERDDGLIRAAAAERYFAEPADWVPFERQALELAAGRVLDVGCGAGRFALALQERGLQVTALDVSPGAVHVSRQRGVGHTVLGTVSDHATAAQRYDTFLLMGENLGLLESADQAHRFLAELATMASPGARIIAHGANPHQTDDPAHVRYQQRNRELGRMPGQMTIRVRHRDLASPWFDYLLCSPGEVAALLAPTTWELTEVSDVDQVNYLAILTDRREPADVTATARPGSRERQAPRRPPAGT